MWALRSGALQHLLPPQTDTRAQWPQSSLPSVLTSTSRRRRYVILRLPLCFPYVTATPFSLLYFPLLTFAPGKPRLGRARHYRPHDLQHARGQEGAREAAHQGYPREGLLLRQELQHVCTCVTFSSVTHTVSISSQEDVNRQFAIGREFYELPLEEKSKYTPPNLGQCS